MNLLKFRIFAIPYSFIPDVLLMTVVWISMVNFHCDLAAAQEREPLTLTCEQNRSGTWQMQNSFGKWIGSRDGWEQPEACNSLIKNSLQSGIVCGWNGTTFQFFNARNARPIGSHNPEAGYLNSILGIQQCSDHSKLQPKNDPFVCAWTGADYRPHHRKTTLAYGPSGWESMHDCVSQALNEVSPLGVCGWNGKHYQIYLLDGTRGPSFDKIENCRGELAVVVTRLNTLEGAKNFYAAINNHSGSLPPAFKSGTPSESVGFKKWKKCEVKADHWHLTQSDENGYLTPECSPDTLYSWGDAAKLRWYAVNLPDGEAWPQSLSRTLYTTSTAAGTFGYGNYPIRFKIKPGVKFRLARGVSTCEAFISNGNLNETTISNTIIARFNIDSDGFSLLEFDICSPAVIESWSFGTKEGLDEILRDQKWMRTKNYKDWEGYTKRNGVDDFINSDVDQDLYGTNFSLKSLKNRLWINHALADFNLGGVFTPAGSDHSAAKHFQTKYPIYFNPN